MRERKPSWATDARTRRSMQSNKGRNTAPEMAIRRLLHSEGLRYRVNTRPVLELRRTADIVFSRQKLAIFIDGCFWHGCPAHYQRPVANREYWEEKVRRNITRDVETDHALRENGWTVLRFWEHENPPAVAEVIRNRVRNDR